MLFYCQSNNKISLYCFYFLFVSILMYYEFMINKINLLIFEFILMKLYVEYRIHIYNNESVMCTKL